MTLISEKEVFRSSPDLMIIIITIFLWLYVSINLNTNLGLIYLGMGFFYWIMRNTKFSNVYPIMKGKPDIMRFLTIGMIFAFVWIYMVSGVLSSVFSLPMTSVPAFTLDTAKNAFGSNIAAMSPLLLLFLMGICVPIIEESSLRGALVPFLHRVFGKNFLMVAIVTGSVFGVLHLLAYNAENTAMMSAFFFGMLMYYITVKTDNLVIPIFCHAMLNTLVMATSLGYLSVGII